MTTKFLLSSDDNTRSGLLKKKIIHYYMANGDATIAEVCKEMNLSIPTVTKLISELQEDGYILDFGKQETSGGRKPSIYGLNPVSGYFVGVDILKDQLNLAILDFKGDKIRIEQNIPYTLENTPAALDHLCECINEFINSLPIPREKILSIGINISGRVNPFAGYSYSIFYFEEKPLSQILEEKLHIKIYIENDTRSMAYGEYLQGVVKGEKNILFINISWGLGIGIIIDGKVYFGKSGFSGEFGHFSFFENEILCHCGKKGCLETGASGSALYRTLLERYKEGSNTILASKIDAGEYIGLSDLIDAIHKEDMLSIEILEEIACGAPALPFYYYHIPAFNNAFLPMLDFLKAVDGRIPNFAGIKYTYESLYEYNQCRLYKDGKFDMLHGQDETILPCLAMGGAQGGIGGTTNYNGKELTGILEAWAAGDLETARERQNFSQEVINVICNYRGNIVGGKRIMKLIGLDLGKNRTPFRNMTDEEEAAMKAELEAINFFERCNKF